MFWKRKRADNFENRVSESNNKPAEGEKKKSIDEKIRETQEIWRKILLSEIELHVKLLRFFVVDIMEKRVLVQSMYLSEAKRSFRNNDKYKSMMVMNRVAEGVFVHLGEESKRLIEEFLYFYETFSKASLDGGGMDKFGKIFEELKDKRKKLEEEYERVNIFE